MMQRESQPDMDSIQSPIEWLRLHINWEEALTRQSALEGQIAQADFCDDQAQAQKIMREKNHLDQQIDAIRVLETGLLEHTELMELAEEEGDAEMMAEALSALQKYSQVAIKKQV